jgi:hypothetical protein
VTNAVLKPKRIPEALVERLIVIARQMAGAVKAMDEFDDAEQGLSEFDELMAEIDGVRG